jgi:hypothetical protein
MKFETEEGGGEFKILSTKSESNEVTWSMAQIGVSSIFFVSNLVLGI